MKLSNIVKELELEIVAGYNEDSEDNDAQGVYICDLLSLVMGRAKENDIWITIQTHVNVIAVSTLVELSAIVIAENMEIDEETIIKANSVNIPLFKSKLTAYELACKLNELGI